MHEITTALENAYASDSFSDSAKAWNEQRRTVIKEALDKHLIPQAVAWTKEWLRDEVEEYLAGKAAEHLEKVCIYYFPCGMLASLTDILSAACQCCPLQTQRSRWP